MWIPKLFVVHHTVTPVGPQWLRAMKNKKAYHIVIDQRGQLRVSVPNHKASVRAVGGANGDTFSIALLGNFETLVPSFASIKTLEQVLAVKLRKFGYNKKSDTQRIVSHNDVAKIRRLGYGTACCGKNLYAKLPALRDSVSRYLI